MNKKYDLKWTYYPKWTYDLTWTYDLKRNIVLKKIFKKKNKPNSPKMNKKSIKS